jgi:hypothetical protein
MAKYMVTAAVMQVPGSTAAGDPAWVYAYRGAVVDLDPDSDAVKHHLDLDMIEKLADVTDDPTVAAGGGPLSEAPVMAVRPADDADKPEWVAFAVRSGLAESDAEMASRDDLVAIFSGGGLSESSVDVAPGRRRRAASPRGHRSPPRRRTGSTTASRRAFPATKRRP